MGLRLVNIFPGSLADYTKPGDHIHLGLKSVKVPGTGRVDIGSLEVRLGLTSIRNEGLLPEDNPNFASRVSSVVLETSERRRPLGPEITRSIVSNSVVLTKGDDNLNDIGIYEIKADIFQNAPILGYFSFRTRTAWTLFNPDWCNLTDMTGVYFGVEHGTYNTACYGFLRGQPGGQGSLVVGGPLSTYGSARGGQEQIDAFNWLSLANNTQVELWVYFNTAGRFPSFIPVVEIWTKRGGVDPTAVLQTSIPIGSLGDFPSPEFLFTNHRSGPSLTATIFFGNIGRTGDVLVLDDWALFPDYRTAVLEGLAFGSNKLFVLPDAPVSYNVDMGQPCALIPGRWFPITDSSFMPPEPLIRYRPGSKKTAQYCVLGKTLPGGIGLQKEEPKLEEREDGAMFEAFLAGVQDQKDGDSFGTGFSLDDKEKLFQVALLESAARKTIGIVKDTGHLSSFDGYHVPASDVDWSSPKVVRMAVDRVREELSLSVDEEEILSVDMATAVIPSSTGVARAAFGHLIPSNAKGELRVGFLNYLTRYKAWEVKDQLLPSASAVVFTLSASGLGSVALDPPTPNATALVVAKTAFASFGSKQYYSIEEGIDEKRGVLVDFKVGVRGYTDRDGTVFAKNCWLGSGVQLFTGNKRLHIGFFDCGIYGRFIGIPTNIITVNDILSQNAAGKSVSSRIDWTGSRKYRLIYRAYDKIEVWTTSVTGEPAIVIPWMNDTDGFGLPSDTTPAGLAFGHFQADPSSITAWEYFRYGMSDGYDVAILPAFPEGTPNYLFGGIAMIRTEFDE